MPLRIAQETPSTYEQRKQEALAATRAARWNDALDLADGCLREQPQDWDVVNARAVALYRLGRVDEAAELMRIGIASSPRPRDFRHNLAFLLLDGGNVVEAARHALGALADKPDSPEISRTVERCRHELVRELRRFRRKSTSASDADRELELRTVVSEIDRALGPAQANEETRTASVPRLSVVMIAKDEERYLADCLRSVRHIADEIIVVDTGSTDHTREIAREFGAKVVEHPWQDDFSDARNVSLDHATGDWALWVDADERLVPESAAKVREIVNRAPKNVGAYMVGIRNFLTAEGKADVFHHRACRLFRLRPEVRFEGRIHEQNTRALEAAGLLVVASDLQIDHLGYTKTMMEERNKHERFITMLRQEIDENPTGHFRHFQMFNLGNAYYIYGDMENARIWFEKSAEDTHPEHDYTAMLYLQWATSLYRTKRSMDALGVCDRAEALGIKHPGIAFARGHALLQLQEFSAARDAFDRAVVLGKTLGALDIGDAGTFTYKAVFGQALADMAEERFESCVERSREALRMNPEFAEARYTLGNGLWRLGQLAEARAEFERLLEAEPDHEIGRSDYIAVLEQLGDHAAVEPHLRSLTQREPGNVDAWLHLAACCEALGNIEGALQAWSAARRLLPDSAAVCVNLGRSIAALGDPATALSCYAQAVELEPTHANAYFNGADAAYQLGRYADAANMLHQALSLDPNNAAGFFVLGNCYARTEDYSAAVVAYRAALERDPSHEGARNNLELVSEQQQAA